MKIRSALGRLLLHQPEHMPLKEYRFFILGNIASTFAALFHASLIPLFWFLEVPPLFYFNFLSVSVFVVAFYLNRSGHAITAFSIGILEVVVHQVLCVQTIGWASGFQYYLLAATTFPFLFWVGRHVTKLIYVLLCFVTFLVLDLLYKTATPSYPLDTGTLEILNGVNIFFSVSMIVMWMFYFHNAVNRAEDALQREYQRAEDLLHNILPVQIADRLKGGSEVIADAFENATIMFADIVGFTEFSAATHPEKVVELLNSIFSRLDELAAKYGIEKIKTVGDAYMVAAGVPEPRDDHANAIADFALEAVSELDQFIRSDGHAFQIRIGIDSGPIVAGVIGKRKFIYDVWGDCVNTAARMESHGIPGSIQVTENVYHLLKDRYDFERREPIDVKSKGLMTTYLLRGRKSG